MASPNTNIMETNTRGGVFERVWRPLRRAWRLLCVCCTGPDDSEIKMSVQETSPLFNGQSSVRPW